MNTVTKGIIFILDGLGDRPCTELNGATPLEAADTPCLDLLAARGQTGLMDPLLAGLPVDTHTGVGILFGMPPTEAITLCRGPIEAAGIGLTRLPGDLLFRANLATVSPKQHHFEIIDRRAGRISDQVEVLCQSLQNIEVGNQIHASLYPATQHRCVLRLRGPHLSAAISDTDPGGKTTTQHILPCQPQHENDESARITAEAVNTFTSAAHRILNTHPVNLERTQQGTPSANGVLMRGAGMHQPHKNLLSHLDIKVAVISGESTILGLARLFGFTRLSDPRFTALPDTDLTLKLKTVKQALENHDLVYLHLKGTDTAAHDKNPQLKRDFISAFDAALGKMQFDNTLIGICADHSTDSVRGEHSGDAVPILIYNPFGRRDITKHYNETDCAQGALNRLTAQSYLTSILDGMGRLGNFKPSSIDYFAK